jgi:hypothetical protein
MSCVFSFLSTLAACGTPTQIDSAKKKDGWKADKLHVCMDPWAKKERETKRR